MWRPLRGVRNIPGGPCGCSNGLARSAYVLVFCGGYRFVIIAVAEYAGEELVIAVVVVDIVRRGRVEEGWVVRRRNVFLVVAVAAADIVFVKKRRRLNGGSAAGGLTPATSHPREPVVVDERNFGRNRPEITILVVVVDVMGRSNIYIYFIVVIDRGARPNPFQFVLTDLPTVALDANVLQPVVVG